MTEATQPREISDEDEYPPTPWHLKLLMLGLALYLLLRFVQLIMWLVERYL